METSLALHGASLFAPFLRAKIGFYGCNVCGQAWERWDISPLQAIEIMYVRLAVWDNPEKHQTSVATSMESCT